MKKKAEQQKEFTREFFVNAGKRGGERTKALHGLQHYEKMLEKRWGKKKVAKDEEKDGEE